jgi:ribosomal protein S6--L-glutamate ligase
VLLWLFVLRAVEMSKYDLPFIALGSRLRGVPEVLTLGVRPNYYDYAPYERELIANARIVLYPTSNYAQYFTTMGKKIFPSLETYIYSDEKIKQTMLYTMLGIPHPRTKIYYRLHHGDILKDFIFPFVGKLPRASSQGRGIFRISNPFELERYLSLTKVAYIQEYIPHERDLRIILINYSPILAYWRKRAPGNFRTNLFQGSSIDFEGIPEKGLRVAQEYSRICNFNDVGLDIMQRDGEWYLIEANMLYGRTALKLKGMDVKEIIRKKLISGELMSPE